MTLLIFLPRSARTRIVAPDFRSCANRLRRFGLSCAGMKPHLFFLALLLAFHFTRERRKRCSAVIVHARSRTGSGGQWTRSRGRRRCLRRRVALHLYLHVVKIAHCLVVDTRHHVFKKNERFFLEFNKWIFLP